MPLDFGEEEILFLRFICTNAPASTHREDRERWQVVKFASLGILERNT